MQIIYNLREHVSYRSILTLRDDIELNELNEQNDI